MFNPLWNWFLCVAAGIFYRYPIGTVPFIGHFSTLVISLHSHFVRYRSPTYSGPVLRLFILLHRSIHLSSSQHLTVLIWECKFFNLSLQEQLGYPWPSFHAWIHFRIDLSTTTTTIKQNQKKQLRFYQFHLGRTDIFSVLSCIS